MKDSTLRPRSICLVGSTIVLATVCAVAAASGAETETPGPFCKPLTDVANLKDIRRRYSDKFIEWSVNDNMANHLRPALERMRAGDFSRPVMIELHWTLMRWPNHHMALEALIRYDLGGGKIHEFEPAECYFTRGRQFAPDDMQVRLAEGYYFWKKDDLDRARRAYESVLAHQPDSPDAHYNLGLLYFEQSEFDKALEHARAAYSQGYPLAGLRRKLAAAGHDVGAPQAQD